MDAAANSKARRVGVGRLGVTGVSLGGGGRFGRRMFNAAHRFSNDALIHPPMTETLKPAFTLLGLSRRGAGRVGFCHRL